MPDIFDALTEGESSAPDIFDSVAEEQAKTPSQNSSAVSQLASSANFLKWPEIVQTNVRKITGETDESISAKSQAVADLLAPDIATALRPLGEFIGVPEENIRGAASGLAKSGAGLVLGAPEYAPMVAAAAAGGAYSSVALAANYFGGMIASAVEMFGEAKKAKENGDDRLAADLAAQGATQVAMVLTGTGHPAAKLVREHVSRKLGERALQKAEDQAFAQASLGAAREQALENTLPPEIMTVPFERNRPQVTPPNVAEAGPETSAIMYPQFRRGAAPGQYGKPGFLMTAEEMVSARLGESPRPGTGRVSLNEQLAREAEDAGLPATSEALRNQDELGPVVSPEIEQKPAEPAPAPAQQLARPSLERMTPEQLQEEVNQTFTPTDDVVMDNYVLARRRAAAERLARTIQVGDSIQSFYGETRRVVRVMNEGIELEDGEVLGFSDVAGNLIKGREEADTIVRRQETQPTGEPNATTPRIEPEGNQPEHIGVPQRENLPPNAGEVRQGASGQAGGGGGVGGVAPLERSEPAPQLASSPQGEVRGTVEQQPQSQEGGVARGQKTQRPVQVAPQPEPGPQPAPARPYQEPPAGFQRDPRVLGFTSGNSMQEAYDAIQRYRRGMQNWNRQRDPKSAWQVAFNAGNNEAVIFAHQEANSMRDHLATALGKRRGDLTWFDEVALSFVVESGGDLAKLAEFRRKVESAQVHWKEKYLRAIQHAENNWTQFESVRPVYERIMHAEIMDELAEGMNVPMRANYVYHAQQFDSGLDIPFEDIGGTGGGGSYMRHRVHPTFADSIAAGVKPESALAIKNMESRIRRGQLAVNRRKWIDAGKNIIDPATQQPIVADVETEEKNIPTVTRSGGVPQLTGRTHKVSSQVAPKDYELVDYFGRKVAIQKGYVGLFRHLTDPSFLARSNVARGVLAIEGSLKHGLLLFDTFHLGRLAYYTAGLGINPVNYRHGLLLLDYDLPTLQRMRNSGEISPALYTELATQKPVIDRLVKQGYNLGGIEDAIYGHWLRQVPGIGKYNKWLFEKFQRGAMAYAGLIEFDRQSRMYPNLSPDQVARKVAKELNTRFGNLRGESWVKSKTLQDLARLALLAPQWNEGLVRSEIGALKGIPGALRDSVAQRRIVGSALTRNAAQLFVGGFLMAQVLNYAFRGKPTWENEERGVNAKISAWIPDVVGNSPGYFFNPAVLPLEIIHQVYRQFERKGKLLEAATDVANYKRSPLMRAVDVLRTRKDQWGKPLGDDWSVVKEAAFESAPIPIPARSALNVARSVTASAKHAVGVPGAPEPTVSEDFPGQTQKQLFATAGIKLESAPTAESRMYAAADDYRRAHNIKNPGDFAPSEYRNLVNAIRIGEPTAIKTELDRLRKLKTDAQIIEHFTVWPTAPVLRSFAHEAKFYKELNPEEKRAYQKMRRERQTIAVAVRRIMAKNPRPKPTP